jgi:hypothetical protein
MLGPEGVAQRLAAVRARVADAAIRHGRRPEGITLVAVSKKQPVQAVCAAYDAGQRDFGENYAQELAAKAQAVAATGRRPRWHFVGALQRNKVQQVLAVADVVHSVDRLALAQALSAGCVRLRQQRPLQVFVQVNVANEPNKAGAGPEDLMSLAQAVSCLPGLQVCGLMALPPDPRATSHDPGDPAAAAARWFEAVAQLSKRLHKALGAPFGGALSMGMSHDFAEAIGAGATLVRVGTAIFGPRAR